MKIFIVSLLLVSQAYAGKLVRLNSVATLIDQDTTEMSAGEGSQLGDPIVSTVTSCVSRTFAESCQASSTPDPPANGAELAYGFQVQLESGSRIAVGKLSDGLELVKECNRRFRTRTCSDGDFSTTPSGSTDYYAIEVAVNGEYLSYDVTDDPLCSICLNEDGTVGGEDAENLDRCSYSADFPDWYVVPDNFGDETCINAQPCEELEVVKSCAQDPEFENSDVDFVGIYNPVDHSECSESTFVDKSRTLYKGACYYDTVNDQGPYCSYIFYSTVSDEWFMNFVLEGSGECWEHGDCPSCGVLEYWDTGRRFTKDGASEPFMDLNDDGTMRCCKSTGNNQVCEDVPLEIRCNAGSGSSAHTNLSRYHTTIVLSLSIWLFVGGAFF